MITVVLTNYKRVTNIIAIHLALIRQSCRPMLFLWDNKPSEKLSALRWQTYVRSENNIACKPRWQLAKVATTKYVCIMDDDLLPIDDDVFADAVNYLELHDEVAGVGMAGVRLDEQKQYQNSKHCKIKKGSQLDAVVDILKGRFILLRRIDLHGFDPNTNDCEDIEVSGHLKSKGMLVLPSILGGRFKNLPTGSGALCSRLLHYRRRESVRRMVFTSDCSKSKGIQS